MKQEPRDAGTVKRNMKALAGVDSNWLELYRLLAARSLALAKASGIEEESFKELLTVINRRQKAKGKRES